VSAHEVCDDEMEGEMAAAKETVALAVVEAAPDGRVTALAPFDATRELPGLLQLAKTLSGARGMIPAHLKSEGEIVAALLAGRELGIPPMMSLRTIHLIDGKVGLDASLQLGLMLRAGVRSQWVESTDERAVLRLTRPGFAPHEQVYAIGDAKAAGLAGKQNWQRHPKAMLRARCVSAAARAYAPDVLTGVYTPDELEEIGERAPVHVESRVVRDEPPAPDVEHVTARAEAQAKERLESDKLADEFGPMIDGCETPEQLLTFAHLNGWALRQLHANARGRLWTRMRKRVLAFVAPGAKSPAGLDRATLDQLAALEREVKDEVAAASGPDDADDEASGETDAGGAA
jgi:hypothetical protein